MKRILFLTPACYALILLLSSCSWLPHSPKPKPSPVRKTQLHSSAPIRRDGDNYSGYTRYSRLNTESNKKLLEKIRASDIQVVNEGHRVTLIVPTDKYYIFNRPELDDLRLHNLIRVVELIKCFPYTAIYVAGFTDNVGKRSDQKLLSQERAQAMVAYLWAHGIPEAVLEAEGYGDKFDIANNKLIHGSALNRRVEIQFVS